MPWRKSKSDGFHITKVGLWFLIFIVVVVIGATNTGNNGLFLVMAVMGGTVAFSELSGRLNVRALRLDLTPPAEIFANNLSHVDLKVENRGRWLPRWLLVVTLDPEDIVKTEPATGDSGRLDAPAANKARRRIKPFLISHLARRDESRGQIELMLQRRGRWRVRFAHVTSLFPLGFFRRGRRYVTDLELLVFPEIYAPSGSRPMQLGRAGNEPTRRRGWGHDLLGLRTFRHGDDPRSIHWKQSARTGEMIFKERETEENRQLLILFDNAVGERLSEADRKRFERLVSEAATAALDHLDSGYEVSLLTRDANLPFASGRQQRNWILETLALIEPVAASDQPLVSATADQPHLSLVMEPERPAGAHRPQSNGGDKVGLFGRVWRGERASGAEDVA